MVTLQLLDALEVMPSSNSSFDFACRHSVASSVVYVLYTLASVIFLLPLCFLVMCIGARRHHVASYSDVLTFHMAAVEMCGVLGSLAYVLSLPLQSDTLLILGIFLFAITFPGQTLLHVLACADRYLAVVHAVAYSRLCGRGTWVRGVGPVCVWLACALWLFLTHHYFPVPTVALLLLFAVCMLLSCFCSLAVLHMLVGPQPGGGAGHARRRALHMVGSITALLALRFVGLSVCFGLERVVTSVEATCLLMDAGLWMSLPSSLLMPVLFLRRARKLWRNPSCSGADNSETCPHQRCC